MDTHLISSIVILLFIACVVSLIAKWFKQPYTIALVLVGLLVALSHITPDISISNDVVFMIVLPPLLFYGAMHMDLEQLKINWKPIAMLAIPGVIASTFLIGYIVHYTLQIDLIYALLFGALITPTDPISVLAILNKVGAPKRLRIILEGESLFNDGTGVVVFSIILGIVTGQDQFTLADSFIKFFKVAIGGTIIGIVVGYLGYTVLKKINDHLLEVALTVVMCFGTPLLAEHFHFSGIIALVVSGMIIGNYGKIYSMSERTRRTLDHFWEVIDFIINSLVFIVIGVELQVLRDAHTPFLIKPIIVAILAVMASRLVVVYPIVWIKNMISHRDLPFNWSHIFFWGGLKGSISIALVVGLPASLPHRELFLLMAFSVVLFTLVIQGMTIKPIINKLGISSE